MPTAQTLLAETDLTPHSGLPFVELASGLETTRQRVPFQCSISVRPGVDVPGESRPRSKPTAQTSFDEAAVTDVSQFWSSLKEVNGLGLWTSRQTCPLKCIVSVYPTRPPPPE